MLMRSKGKTATHTTHTTAANRHGSRLEASTAYCGKRRAKSCKEVDGQEGDAQNAHYGSLPPQTSNTSEYKHGRGSQRCDLTIGSEK